MTPSQIPGRVEPNHHAIMSLGDHLEDLRRRIILALLGIIPIFIVAFAMGQPLLKLLIDPARRQLKQGGQATTLLATAPFETFGTVVHLAVVVTVLVGAPWILYQLWKFISPGLYAHERRVVRLLIPFSGVLTILSMLFLYFVILPVILAFFIGFGANVAGSLDQQTAPVPEGIVIPMVPVLSADPDPMEPGMTWINDTLMQQRYCVGLKDDGTPLIRSVQLTTDQGIVQQYKISEYIRTVLNMGLAFAIAFQTPVVVIMLGWVGILDPGTMTKYRRHAIAACSIAGALLTPADPLSMILLAVPLYLLYELGLFVLRVFPLSRVIGDLNVEQDPSATTDDHHEAGP